MLYNEYNEEEELQMINKLKLKNFKSLTDFEADLNVKKNSANSLALIYGGNAAGKTTFAQAFEFLQRSIWEAVNKYPEKRPNELEVNENRGQNRYLEKLLGIEVHNSLYDEYKTAGVSQNLEIAIEFTVKGKRGRYILDLNSDGVVYEKLEFALNQRMVRLYEVSEKDMDFSSSLFLDRAFKEKSLSEIKRKFGTYTVLSCLNTAATETKMDIFKKYLHPEAVDLLVYFVTIAIYFNNIDRSSIYSLFSGWETDTYLELCARGGARKEIKLYEGKISANETEYLRRAEEVLNYILRKLFPDIDQVYYRENTLGSQIEYELYLRKMVGKSLRDISFRAESTGTKKVLAILPYLLDAVNGRTVVIDEFESGLHNLLAEELLEDLAGSINGQLIITTHDTLLMNTVSPKHVYLLSTDNQGNRELFPLSVYAIQKGYNVQDRYLRGEYDGIPYTGSIDFLAAAEIMNGKQ